MIVDGKLVSREIQEELRNKIRKLNTHPKLAVIVVGNDPVSARYVKKKQKFGEEISISVDVYKYEEDISTEELISEIQSKVDQSDGMIVQLPLPKHMNSQEVLNAVPESHDVDVLSELSQESFKTGKLPILPPVIAGFAEILSRNNVSVKGKKVVVVGKGKLVGAPAAIWFERVGGKVTVIGKGDDLASNSINADIIALGAGVPGLLKPEMIKEGVVILDAGTSEEGGELKGDADPRCAEKASIFTPVPGGIGPMTVAVLLKNLIILNTNE